MIPRSWFRVSAARAGRALLSAAALLALAPRPAAGQEVQYQVRASASPCARVRARADAGATVLDCIAPGTRVAGLESAPFWRKVRLADGHEGWVARKYLEMTSAAPVAGAAVQIPRDAWLEVHFVDVGQGDGIWIHTHDDGIDGNGVFEGRNVVIDGGPRASAGEQPFWAYLLERGHRGAVVDALLVTHPHADHWHGSDGVLEHFDVASFYDPAYPKGGTYDAFLERVRRETARGEPARVMLGRDRFDAMDWGRELQVRVLWAYPGSPEGLGTGNTVENNASLVLRLEYGDVSFLLMGDAEGKDRDGAPEVPRFVEQRLLSDVRPEDLRSTVLKVGHHGSETSSTLPFLDAVQPRFVVISSGRQTFGGRFLPDPTTVRRICDRLEVELYRTDQDDDSEGRNRRNDADADHVVIATNGRDVEVRAFSNGRLLPPQRC